MELFKNTNFDFLGKKWPFIILSLVLTAAGLISIAMQGGLKYGIDFKGGALMTVKFAGPPPLEKIRSAMTHSDKIKGGVSVQNFIGATAQNEVEIGTELQNEAQLNINRQAMEDVLFQTFGQPASGKLDFNNASQEALVNRLRDPIARAGIPMSDQQLQQLVHGMLSVRDSDHSGSSDEFQRAVIRTGHECWYYEHTPAGDVFGSVSRHAGADGWAEGRRRPQKQGDSGHTLCARRHARLYRLPL